ncbi:MAG: DUF305 domain-containing protein [Sphingomonadaceae bacterium]|nr:DUF305 domain-containing protein [Sphingomonadaceae bacterium]
MRVLVVAALLIAAPAAAQHAGHHVGAEMATRPDQRVTPDADAAHRELDRINARMHAAMDVKPTGNLDADFVRSMLPHHQGAIDAAELMLRQSNDPRIRTLARGIIVAQKREQMFMRAWLKEHGFAER